MFLRKRKQSDEVLLLSENAVTKIPFNKAIGQFKKPGTNNAE